ncbi:hypothetical protein ACU686_14715 [Yinghuangia aomiensis]
MDTPQLHVDAHDAGVPLAEMHARYAEEIPFGRIGRPEKIAAAVSLLTDFGVGALAGQYCYIPDLSGSGLIESPRKALEMWSDEFEALRTAGGCFVLTNHPFLSGRPARAAALEELVRSAVEATDVWVASLGEIAEHVRGLGLAPRSITRPELPEADA